MADITVPLTVTTTTPITREESAANANATTQAARPGWMTSEFALSSVTAVLGYLLVSGVVADGTTWARVIGGALAILSTLGYTYGRSAIKAATNRASVLMLVVLLGLAGAAPGCATTQSQRATTIQTAQVVVTTAVNGMLAYDKIHQDELARSGTPDEAAAALKAYRAKRAKFDLALTATADAIIVAVTLNDQPSLDGLARAITEVIRDYQDLKGIKP